MKHGLALLAALAAAMALTASLGSPVEAQSPADPAELLHDLENGCGSADGSGVPEFDLGAVFNFDVRVFFGTDPNPITFRDGCSEHDVCYGTLGASKERCDVEFGLNLAEACYEKYAPLESVGNFFQPWRYPLLKPCISQGWLYSSAVLLLGDLPFADAQKDAEYSAQQCRVRQQGIASGLWLGAPILNVFAESGCHLTNAAVGDGRWVAVMSHSNLEPWSWQSVEMFERFDDLLGAALTHTDSGRTIAAIAGEDLPNGVGRWYLTVKEGSHGGSVVLVEKDLEEIIGAVRDQGAYLWDLEWDGEDWLAVISWLGTGEQDFFQGSLGAVSGRAAEVGETGLVVTDLEYGPGGWVIVYGPVYGVESAASGIVCPDCATVSVNAVVPTIYNLRVAIERASASGIVTTDVEYGEGVWATAWYRPATPEDPQDEPPRFVEAEIPDVQGETWADASRILREAGFEPRQQIVRPPVTDPDEVGRVIDQDPRAGTFASAGSIVEITMGGELEVTQVEVPDVLGDDLSEAEFYIEQAGLNPVYMGEEEVPAGSAYDGNVSSQWPAGGTMVEPDTDVQIWLGVAEEEDLVSVPCFEGQLIDDAMDAASGNGIDLRISGYVEWESSDYWDDRVMSQSEACGSMVPRWTTVYVQVEDATTTTDTGGYVDALTVTLRWTGPADLELTLTTPWGSTIDRSNQTADGGEFQGDEGSCSSSGSYEEVIVFAGDRAPAGEYEAEISTYCSDGTIDWELEIVVAYDGEMARTVWEYGDSIGVTHFTFPY